MVSLWPRVACRLLSHRTEAMQLHMEAFFQASVIAVDALSHTNGSSLFSTTQADTEQMCSALQHRADWNPAIPCLALRLRLLFLSSLERALIQWDKKLCNACSVEWGVGMLKGLISLKPPVYQS